MSWNSYDQLLILMKKQLNDLAKLSIKYGNLYNTVDSSKNTLLHYAAEYGNPEIVQFLIDSDCEVDAQNDLGQTPLIRSLRTELPCKKVVEILLRADADIFVKDNNNKSALGIVDCMKWLNEDINRFEILKIFLELANDVYEFDVLYIGEPQRDAFVTKSLLQTNINLGTINDRTGRTFVHIFAGNCNRGVVEQLHGRDFDVNVRDHDGLTPLMYAARYAFNVPVEFLLNEGADVEATDYTGSNQTSLHLAVCAAFEDAVENEIKQSVQALLEHGANVQVETNDDRFKTIFDVFLEYEEDLIHLVELPLAHLALEEALGTTVTDLIRSKVNEEQRFKTYFECCQRQLLIEIHPLITLLNLLAASERKLERYLRNEELASKFIDFHTGIGYFDTILKKHITNANRMVKLRETAVPIVCKLIKVHYDSYPFLVDEIVSYLKEEDIECLILIENEL